MTDIQGVPLTYVIRPNMILEHIINNPLLLLPDELLYSAKYENHHDKLIDRASYSDPSFAENNA